jgi:Peptidase family M23
MNIKSRSGAWRVGIAMSLLVCPLCSAIAETSTVIPDVRSLEARVTAALGGASNLAAFHSLRAVGTMEGISGFPGSYELEALAPDRRKVTWDIHYLRQTTAVDAGTGWERSAAVRELAGDELARNRRDARFNALFILMRAGTPLTVEAGECAPGKLVYLMRFVPSGGTAETFGVDQSTYLPVCYTRTESYEEGPAQIRTDYADYRRVQGLMLPFVIDEARPENSLKIHITKYEVNPALKPGTFGNPESAKYGEPISIELATLPEHIYKEADGHYTIGPQRYWGMYFYPTESWSLDVMVMEKHGRYLEPQRARAEFYAGSERAFFQEWSSASLRAMRRYPVTRFTPQGEIYGFRHNFSVASTERIDRIVYSFEGKAADGRIYAQSLTIPITTYEPRTQLIFPVKGKFLVTSGHEFYEKEHKYERSQQFAIDIVALGDDFEFARNDGATVDDYVGYARREIIAPADGRVAFARNDIPDGAVKSDFLKMDHAITAPAGNVVIIDHGNGEFSVFCHMHFGSVRVKAGDVVRQGQAIGLLGAAGSPGLPHLHYQLQNGPNIFGNDGLPLVFGNIERVGWLGRYGADDERGAAPVSQPRAGVFMEAR